MAITTQRIKDLNTVSEVPSGSKLLLTPDNGSYARATVPNIVGSAMDTTEDFKINSTTNKIELKIKKYTGTSTAWEQLSAAQKAQYTYVNFTDDGGDTIEIDSVPTQNSTNAVSSGGVYDALQPLTAILGNDLTNVGF